MAQKKQRKATKDKDSVWQSTATANLIRYVPSGKYYLRGRFGGYPRRECLGTTNYKAAVVKLGERMSELRIDADARSGEAPATLGAALGMVRVEIDNTPSLKTNTRRSYIEELGNLDAGKPAAVPLTPLSRLSAVEMTEWWAKSAKAYAPQRANHLLMFVRRALKKARKCGAIFRDPTEEIKRVKIPRTRLDLPTIPKFLELVKSIRSQGKARSAEVGDWVEFMAYSGLRPKEIREVLVADLLEAEGRLRVTGGIDRTKNGEDRYVPLIPPMLDLLARMRSEGRVPQAGKVFRLIKSPRAALKNACARVGINHQRIYDLRHLFASTCNESGVDVPTFAKWLGHKDGGALAMKTYVHSHDDHSQRSAAKVKF